MGFSKIEGKLDFRAFWKEVPTKVLHFDAKYLVEAKKALEGYGVHKGHHCPLTGPSPNPKAIPGLWEGRGPGRKRDPHVVFIQLSDRQRSYRLDAFRVFTGPYLENNNKQQPFKTHY